LGVLLIDLEARRGQVPQHLRDSDSAVERLKVRVAGASIEAERRPLKISIQTVS